MKLYKFKKAYQSYKIRSILSEYDIPQHKIDEIVDRIDYRLYFYDDEINDIHLSVLERLSIIPLYVVMLVMILIVMPIKWVFTGKYRLEEEKPAWLWEWANKFW